MKMLKMRPGKLLQDCQLDQKVMLMDFLLNISVCPFPQKPLPLQRESRVNVPGKLAVHIVSVAQTAHFPLGRQVSLNHSNQTTVVAY